MSQTGRLAAILAANVPEYWRLMGADEEGTLERMTRGTCSPHNENIKPAA